MRQGQRVFIATTMVVLAQASVPARSWHVTVEPGRDHVVINSEHTTSQAEFRNLQLRRATDTPRSSTTPPSITGGRILTPTLDVSKQNAYIKLSVDISVPGQYYYCAFYLTAPSGDVYSVPGEFLRPGTTSGTVVAGTSAKMGGYGTSEMVMLEPTGFLQPGTYTLTAASILDYAGNGTTYNASQIATMFNGNTITVVNRNTPDLTPPKIVSAEILTRKVSRSAALPYVAIRVNATDDYSGVASVEVITFTGAPGGSVAPTANAAIPFTNGSLTTFVKVNPDTPTGTYYIEEFYACDAAGHCLIDADPNDYQGIFKGKATFEIVD